MRSMVRLAPHLIRTFRRRISRSTGRSGKKYKLLSEAQREAAIARDRGSLVRIVRVTDDGSRMVVEEE